MKYLVLGSEGQIGKPLTKFLRSRNHEVLEYDIKRNIDEDLRKLHLKKQKDIFLKKIKKCDFVFFLAFDVGGSKYLLEKEDKFDYMHNNVSLMKNVFEFLKEYKKPFIFTSTQMADMVHSSYGNAKLIGEKYTKSLNGIFVKLWNVYGPELNIEEDRCHVITDFIRAAITKKSINMLTSGQECRQFLYVEDCCEALLFLSQQYEDIPRHELLHISSFEWSSVEKVAQIISSIVKCNYTKGAKTDKVQLNLKYEPDPNILKYWKPRISLEEGIQRIIDELSER